MSMRPEAIAAVLGLPDAVAAEKRHRWLEARQALPCATDGLILLSWPDKHVCS